ncbi:hypothetical protein C8F04DRAFT_953162 [Mycena alexandri]|uniref:Uncharacterized protein n=1 Tax=Mycena alexandri TaxID=1745969 RepID=A0AAD6T099_9AGAR|nr:hypothetical protein C8F04DRAFT_953162 [Mycena alexandri]
MTSRLLGGHNLSTEQLRYPSRYRHLVPREFKLCRFCQQGVEDEVHTLFDCTHQAHIIELRSRLLDSLAPCDPVVWGSYGVVPSYDFLLKVAASRKAVQLFAKYIFIILGAFQEPPRFFPVVFRRV